MTIDGERSDARVASSRDEEEEEAPAAAEYGDLLDAQWLERETDVLERDDDLVDIGLTLDLDDDEEDENAYFVDLDVGTLLTSLLPAGADSDSSEPALNDGSLASGALSELLLPEERRSDERTVKQRADDDEAVGDDEQFPAFDESGGVPERPAGDDDGSEGVA
jgi:hypothetical protein